MKRILHFGVLICSILITSYLSSFKLLEKTYANNDLYVQETIIKVSAGKEHSGLLTSRGRLFLWGHGGQGRLGTNGTASRNTAYEITAYAPFTNLSNDYVVDFELGAEHSGALTAQGRMFMWGEGSDGRLGQGLKQDEWLPVNITGKFSLSVGEKITQIALGGQHSAALTNRGKLYMWGRNSFGRIGNNSTLEQLTPLNITSIVGSPFSTLAASDLITKVALGSEHSAAITSTGKVFTWGNNRVGQLGIGRTSYEQTLPQNITTRFLLSTNEKIVDISLGREHTMALSSSGKLFTWGGGGEGRLGNSSTTNQTSPVNITYQGDFINLAIDPIRTIEAGLLHSGARSQNGRLFVWGAGGNGRLGTGSTINQLTPKEITRQGSLVLMSGKIEVFSLGFEHTLIANNLDRIYSVGLGANGRLGGGTDTTIFTPNEISLSGPLISIYNYNRAVTVMNLIANLPDDPMLIHRSAIAIARQNYNFLNLSQQTVVNNFNYARLVTIESKLQLLITQYESVIQLFVALPQIVTLAHQNIIENARQAYNNLNEEQQNVSEVKAKLPLLVAAEGKLETLYQQIEDVMAIINALPDIVTMNDEEQILQAEAAFNNLHELQKQRVEQYLKDKLTTTRQKLQVLLDQITTVINLIQAIPPINEIRINQKANITSIRNEYDKLVPKQKERIGLENLALLVAAEQRIIVLEVQVEDVRTLILALPHPMSLDGEMNVIQTREAYNALHVTQQALLSDVYYLLIEAEATLIAIKEAANEVDRLILALPDQIQLTHEQLVIAIRTKYDLLSQSQRDIVLHYDEFLPAEARIASLLVIVHDFNTTVEALPQQVVIADKPTIVNLLETYQTFDEAMKERTAIAYQKLLLLSQSIRTQEGLVGFVTSTEGIVLGIASVFAIILIVILALIKKNRPKIIKLPKLIRAPRTF